MRQDKAQWPWGLLVCEQKMNRQGCSATQQHRAWIDGWHHPLQDGGEGFRGNGTLGINPKPLGWMDGWHHPLQQDGGEEELHKAKKQLPVRVQPQLLIRPRPMDRLLL
jgi:hypothetical protein